jgi:hypothetical protein
MIGGKDELPEIASADELVSDIRFTPGWMRRASSSFLGLPDNAITHANPAICAQPTDSYSHPANAIAHTNPICRYVLPGNEQELAGGICRLPGECNLCHVWGWIREILHPFYHF